MFYGILVHQHMRKGEQKKKDKKELRKALTIIGQCLIDKMCREAVLRTGDPVVKYEYPS